MTEPTPAEQAEITRFGIFDDDIIQDLETQFGEDQ